MPKAEDEYKGPFCSRCDVNLEDTLADGVAIPNKVLWMLGIAQMLGAEVLCEGCDPDTGNGDEP